MKAHDAYSEGVKKQAPGRRRSKPEATVQYTVRDVPAKVDALLRRRAAEQRTSLTHVLREALLRAAGLGTEDEPVHDDLDHLASRWEHDPEFDAAVAAQDQVDDELWR
jgi:plasmid stability protein